MCPSPLFPYRQNPLLRQVVQSIASSNKVKPMHTETPCELISLSLSPLGMLSVAQWLVRGDVSFECPFVRSSSLCLLNTLWRTSDTLTIGTALRALSETRHSEVCTHSAHGNNLFSPFCAVSLMQLLFQVTELNFDLDLDHSSFLDESWIVPIYKKIPLPPLKQLDLRVS